MLLLLWSCCGGCGEVVVELLLLLLLCCSSVVASCGQLYDSKICRISLQNLELRVWNYGYEVGCQLYGVASVIELIVSPELRAKYLEC